MLYIGLMSGTSMDAVDAALVQFNETSTLLLAYEEYPLDPGIRRGVRNLSPSSSINEVSRYDTLLGNLFAEVALKLIQKAGITPDSIKAIGSHGQTVLHLPENDHTATMQIGDPNIIALKTGITTVGDFRRMDTAAGGQGAPLAPAFHEYLFRDYQQNYVILNIGGIANITILSKQPDAPVIGFDTGPGNGLLDDWNQLHNGTNMDKDSAWASGGSVDQALLNQFMADPYLHTVPPKSTGRDYFNLAWIRSQISRRGGNIESRDVMATLFKLTIHNIVNAIGTHATDTETVLVCGGGARNQIMLAELKRMLGDRQVITTTEKGYNPDAIEAMTFAWLAKRRLDLKRGNLPTVTGARKGVILGAVYQS